MASLGVTTPSPLPPLIGLSYSAKAKNPFRSWPKEGPGWGVKLPNNSEPSSIPPFPFLSSASQASSEDGGVQEMRCAAPTALMSKSTPAAALESWNPLPATSISIGERQPAESGSHSHGFGFSTSKKPQPSSTAPPQEWFVFQLVCPLSLQYFRVSTKIDNPQRFVTSSISLFTTRILKLPADVVVGG